MARPRFDRDDLFDCIRNNPRAGRGLVRVNERKLGSDLGWSRATVAAGIRDLESSGVITRVKVQGRSGLLLSVRPQNDIEVAGVA